MGYKTTTEAIPSTLDSIAENVRLVQKITRALNHKLRQQIIEQLEVNEKMTVTDLYIKLRLEQSVASQHLAILRRVKAVKTKREGKWLYYSLDKKALEAYNKTFKQLIG